MCSMRITRASFGCVLVCVCAVTASACRVAVVGGGVGGAFSAAFLHQLLGASVAIDVYAIYSTCSLTSEGPPPL